MMNLKYGLIILAAAAAVGLSACGKKEEAAQAPAENAASAPASEETPVQNIEVSPDMIDAAPMDEPAASEAAK